MRSRLNLYENASGAASQPTVQLLHPQNTVSSRNGLCSLHFALSLVGQRKERVLRNERRIHRQFWYQKLPVDIVFH